MREEERFDTAINCLPLRLKRFAQTISREEKRKTEEISRIFEVILDTF